jgi:SecD/SecF fusion protein
MSQTTSTCRRRWSRLSLVVLAVVLALGALALLTPHALAQVGDSAPGATAVSAGGQAIDQVEGRWEGAIKLAIVVALFVVPIMVGSWLAKTLKMPEHGWKFAIALGTIAAAAVVVATGEIKLGPDLSGGITLIYELAEDQSTAAPAEAAGVDAKVADDDEDATVADTDSDADRSDDDGPANAADTAGMSKDQMVSSLIGVLSRRIDPTGVMEVSIRKYGEGQIEIIIPRAEKQELEFIERQISTAGLLVFRITASDRFSEHDLYINLATDPELTPVSQDVVRSEGKEIARWVEIDPDEFETGAEDPLAVARARGLVTRMAGKTPQALVITDDGLDVTGDFLKTVAPDVDETGKPQVSFSFNSQGAFLFGQLTGEHLPNNSGQRYNLGILLDNRLLSAPTIESKITDRGRISGSMSDREVKFLVDILKAGQLPAALNKEPISRAQISPTLGAQTIEKGKVALGISLALVMAFMVFYYRAAGIVACIGLALNMLLIVGCMVLIKAAFTLPGLAGLVLTVGMSVDANVLIYERIREELKRGAALRMAIRNGFDRATTTIIDSNVTNLITGIVIYKIAPDNVKGFGVTLVLGIAMSIFVAVFLTRIAFDVLERKGILKTLRMREFVGVTNFDFLAWRRVCIAGSLIVIAIGLLAVAHRGGDLFDIDFTGGSSVQFVLDEDEAMDFDAVLAALNETSLADQNLSLVRIGESNTHYSVTTIDDDVKDVENILKETFAGKLRTYDVEVLDVMPIAPTGSVGQMSPIWRHRQLPGALAMPGPFGLAALLQAPADDEASVADEAASTDTASPADGAAADDDEEDVADATAPAAESPPAEADAETAGATAERLAAGSPFADGGTSATIRFAQTGLPSDGDATSGLSYNALHQLLSEALKDAGHEGVAFEITNADYTRGTARSFDEWTVRIALPETDAQQVLSGIESSLDSQPIFPLSNKIGGRVAARMATDAIAAVILCLAGIIGYVWFRFHGVYYGLAAVAALVHDVLISLGFVALSSYLVTGVGPLANLLLIDKFQVSLTLVAAFLTIIGYSLNDTIVIFDRIREVKGKSPRLTADMINAAVNQCFARTLLTGFTSLISVFVLYVVGGEGIHAFAFALLVGFVAGMYSTIYIANPVLLWLAQRAEATAARASATKAA